MLDVHPPHHAVHAWKDFLIHIATIVVGLLIAIGLEQAVEGLHHRHLRHGTRENLATEIGENREQLKDDTAALERERLMLEKNLTTLRGLRNHTPGTAETPHFYWYWSSMSDAAWQTARETTALALLPNEEVQRLSFLYGQQAHVNEAGIALSASMTAASIPLRIEPDVTKLTPAQIDELMHNCADNLNRIEYMGALIDGLKKHYEDAAREP